MSEKYEVALVKYPELEPPDNLWWTVVCPTMRGCVSDGLTREEALAMVASQGAVTKMIRRSGVTDAEFLMALDGKIPERFRM